MGVECFPGVSKYGEVLDSEQEEVSQIEIRNSGTKKETLQSGRIFQIRRKHLSNLFFGKEFQVQSALKSLSRATTIRSISPSKMKSPRGEESWSPGMSTLIPQTGDVLRFALSSQSIAINPITSPVQFLSQLHSALRLSTMQLRVVRIQSVNSAQRIYIYVDCMRANASSSSTDIELAPIRPVDSLMLASILNELTTQMKDPTSVLRRGELTSKILEIALIQDLPESN
eukprot:TRINITY_DN9354_c0_g1_i8.p1 TRINITY_DN9354_c0_g1~~TRINITY_DN9354_c0_g1_i8.p1  ORF type:complete len:237 (-),score=33.68 TRINITY_DN9354_c0_g1_i8:113-796(-)